MKKIHALTVFTLITAMLLVACKKKGAENPINTISPVANFVFDNPDESVPAHVSFTNKSQNAVSYEWNFGNGTTSTEVNPVATYATAGNYTVSLMAKNGGRSDTMTVTIAVAQPPVASFTIEKLTQYTPMRVKLVSTSQNADSYIWDLGYMNMTSTQPSLEFEYKERGTYTIKLTAKKGTRQSVDSQNVVVADDQAMVAHYMFNGGTTDSSSYGNHCLGYYVLYSNDRSTTLPNGSVQFKLADIQNKIKPALQMSYFFLKNAGAATSISLWFKRSDNSRGCLLSCQDKDFLGWGYTPTQYNPIAYLAGDTLYVKLWNGSVEPLVKIKADFIDKWHHLVIAADATDQKVYFDGTLQGTVSGAFNYLDMGYNFLGAGFMAQNGPWPGSPSAAESSEVHFYGGLDDVRIYKKKISEAEVKALYSE